MTLPPLQEILGREPAIPVGLVVYGQHYSVATPTYDRVLLGHYELKSGRMWDDLERYLRPSDIVYVPLHAGTLLRDRYLTFNFEERCQAYDENIKMIERIAPHVRGILTGNAGPEVTGKELWLGSPDRPRSMMSDFMCDFVREVAEIIVPAGGKPWFGIIDWDLSVDCHFGGGRVRDAINALGGGNIAFTGYNLFGPGSDVPHPIVPHPNDAAFWQVCPILEEMPKPKMTEYLRGWNEGWSGADGLDGLLKENDTLLKNGGFKGLFMGFPGEAIR